MDCFRELLDILNSIKYRNINKWYEDVKRDHSNGVFEDDDPNITTSYKESVRRADELLRSIDFAKKILQLASLETTRSEDLRDSLPTLSRIYELQGKIRQQEIEDERRWERRWD